MSTNINTGHHGAAGEEPRNTDVSFETADVHPATIYWYLGALAVDAGLAFVAPPPALCTDNGAMIAWAGVERLRLGLADPLDAPVRPRWPLDPDAFAAKMPR